MWAKGPLECVGYFWKVRGSGRKLGADLAEPCKQRVLCGILFLL